MATNDLAFIIDDPAGYGVTLAGDYAGWTLGQVEWWDVSGSEPQATGESLFAPATMQASAYAAVVTATSADGTETVTLTSITVSGYERESYGSVFRDLTPEPADGTSENVTVVIGAHTLTGVGFHSEFHGSSNNIYVAQANGIYTEYQYDTATGEQGYIAAEDRDDVMDWQYLSSEFQNGELVREIEVGDDGVYTETNINDGEITDTLKQDELDAHDYESIFTLYQGGQIVVRETIYDDGARGTAHYDNGLLQETQLVDEADTNAYDTISRYYDDGVINVAYESMDDGREITRSYSNGEIASVVTQDEADAHNYTEIHVIYQTDSRLHFTIYDDSRTLERTFVAQPDGTGQRIDSWRMQDNDDAHSWTEQHREYDENNKLELSVKVDDDGVDTITTYDAGVRVQTTITDMNDARNFTTSDKFYADGVIAAQFTQMDDGRENEWLYDGDGNLMTYRSVDTADAFNWTETTRHYDTNGDSLLFRLYDNGVEQNDTYIAGQRTLSERVDVDDAKNWYSITDQFEDGVRVSRDIVWDDDGVM